MMAAAVLVDSNVILDVFTSDPTWYEWSSDALARCAETSQLVVNPIVYAEVSVRFPTIEELDLALPASTFRRDQLRGRQPSSLESASSTTASAAERGKPLFRTSTSEPMPRWPR